jgi:hypothetical protein
VTVVAAAFLAGIAFHVVAAGSPSQTEEGGTTATTNPAAAASPGDLGPATTIDGAPSGFARTDGGAVAAAVAYVTTGQDLLDMDPLAAEHAVRQMAAESTADQQVSRMLSDLRSVREMLRSGTGPIIYRQACLAARVDRLEGDEARVAIWNVGILSREGVASPQAGWQISTFDLVWERDDWRIRSEIVTPGPAPAMDASAVPATSAQLAAQLDGFQALMSAGFSMEGGR